MARSGLVVDKAKSAVNGGGLSRDASTVQFQSMRGIINHVALVLFLLFVSAVVGWRVAAKAASAGRPMACQGFKLTRPRRSRHNPALSATIRGRCVLR